MLNILVVVTYSKIIVYICKKFGTMKKRLLLVMFLVATGLVFVASGVRNAGLKNYQCRKCAAVVRAENIPPTIGCRVDGTHQWQELGPVGMQNYHCVKCRTNVESRLEPSMQNCPNGGNHQWNPLGKKGPLHYQCRKCGLDVRSADTPNSLSCPNGGNHQWYKMAH